MKFNKKITTLVSVATGAVILATAAFANYLSQNGYDVYKSSVKKLVREQNYTLDVSANIRLDGDIIECGESIHEEIDIPGNALYRIEEVNALTEQNKDFVPIEETSVKNNTRTSKTNFTYTDSGDIKEEITAYVRDIDQYSLNGTIARYTEGVSDETVDKTIRFLELASDMLVGDLKNNFVYIGEKNGEHIYSIELESFQIPEIINAGLSIISSSYKDEAEVRNAQEHELDPLERIYENLTVKNGSCRLVTDDLGRMTQNTIVVEFNGNDFSGENHTLSLELNVSVSKYGETIVSDLDLSDCAKVIYSSEKTKERNEVITEIMSDAASETEKENYKTEIRQNEIRLQEANGNK